MNPFRYGCVVAGENFCPRPELQRQLRELLRSGQNVVVQGPRRMGKTSLVCETVRSVRGMKDEYVFEYEGRYRFENPFFKAWLMRDVP